MRVRPAAILVSLALALATLPAQAQAGDATEDRSCRRHDLRLRIAPGEQAGHHIAGWLCVVSPHRGQTVILASPSGFSTHAYWDWPADKDTYSFVRAFTRAGYAVFNYDRLGTGSSERPAAALVNLHSEAYLQHQLVRLLRSGGIGGIRFGSVVLAGNSLSTLIDIFQAELFQDVDGLINTGIFVGPSPVGLASLFSSLYPAQLDPKFAGDPDIPPGYATTQPGTRSQFFHLPASEEHTIRLDERLKDTGTLGEAGTFAAWYPLTRLVDVPILSVVGDHDILACLTVCEPGGVEETKERLFWSDSTCLEIEILPDTGHFVQLQANSASAFTRIARDWLSRRIGVDRARPATAPCRR